jgi:hypothetical protein
MEKARFVLVAGPPGSGKSYYVQEHRRPDDLVIDEDAIWHAFTGLPYYEKPAGLRGYILAARDAVMYKASSMGAARTVWVIRMLPNGQERAEFAARHNAQVIVLDTSPNTCLKRIKADTRRSKAWLLWEPTITEWWSKYTPWEGDKVVHEQ